MEIRLALTGGKLNSKDRRLWRAPLKLSIFQEENKVLNTNNRNCTSLCQSPLNEKMNNLLHVGEWFVPRTTLYHGLPLVFVIVCGGNILEINHLDLPTCVKQLIIALSPFEDLFSVYKPAR
jgi:hypothetical protein